MPTCPSSATLATSTSIGWNAGRPPDEPGTFGPLVKLQEKREDTPIPDRRCLLSITHREVAQLFAYPELSTGSHELYTMCHSLCIPAPA